MTAINTLDSGAATADIAKEIRLRGAVIVSGVLDQDDLAMLNTELTPLLDATQGGREDFTGHKTKRFGALMAKCPASRNLAVNPFVLDVVQQVLGPYCARFQLNYTGVMYIEPGERGANPPSRHRHLSDPKSVPAATVGHDVGDDRFHREQWSNLSRTR